MRNVVHRFQVGVQLEQICQRETDSCNVEQLYVNYVLEHITQSSWQKFWESVELSRNFCYQKQLNKENIIARVKPMTKCAEDTCENSWVKFHSFVNVSSEPQSGLMIPKCADFFWRSSQLKLKNIYCFYLTNGCETA